MFCEVYDEKNQTEKLPIKSYKQKYKYEPFCKLTKVFVAPTIFFIFWGYRIIFCGILVSILNTELGEKHKLLVSFLV